MEVICGLFDHKFKYFITQDIPQRNFRVCIHCSKLQEFKTNLPFTQKAWVSLVQRTNEDATSWLKENPEELVIFSIETPLM
jgi:hypothetical protein